MRTSRWSASRKRRSIASCAPRWMCWCSGRRFCFDSVRVKAEQARSRFRPPDGIYVHSPGVCGLEDGPAPQFINRSCRRGSRRSFSPGSRSLIEEKRPMIYFELHGPEEQEAVRDLLQASRYKTETLSGLEVPDPTAGCFNPLICNPE